MRFFLLAFASALFLPQDHSLAAPQWTPGDKAESKGLIRAEIDQALEESRWQVGPFRLIPELQIGAGYDSNGLSAPIEPAEDTVFLAAPGIRTVVPVRNRALFDLSQEVHFVYYRELEPLRDIFSVTRLGGAVGGNDLLFRFEDEFRVEKVRPTSELDLPLDQRANRLEASLRLSLGWRQEMALLYENARYRIEDPLSIDGVPVGSLFNRNEDYYVLQFVRRLTARTNAVFEGSYEPMDFLDDEAERDAAAYRIAAGFSFSPRGGISGAALLGYKRLVPKVVSQADYRGLVGSVDVRTRLGRRLRVRGVYSRDSEPSAMKDNWFFVETRYGGFLDLFLTDRVFLRPGALLGNNDYPRPIVPTDAVVERSGAALYDRFQIYSFSVNYHLTPRLILRLESSYLIRKSNYAAFDKERLLLNFGLTTELWPAPQAVRARAWMRRH